jgi:hypothetical protein
LIIRAVKSGALSPDPLALQLLGPDDVRIAGVQREQGVWLSAPAFPGRPLLPADL